jgi:hypothetical protein
MAQTGALADGKPIPNGYGMGLGRAKYRGLETVAHGGALGGYRTMFFRIPAKKFTAVCRCNNGTANAARLAQQMADIWLEGEFDPALPTTDPPKPPSPPTLTTPDAALRAAVSGDWYSPELGASTASSTWMANSPSRSATSHPAISSPPRTADSAYETRRSFLGSKKMETAGSPR